MRGKVLIVDDCSVNRKALESILQSDYQLAIAENGEQALAVIQGFKPDVAILDIMMEGMDGYQLCARLREDPSLKRLKILFVSGECIDLSDRLKGYQRGADDYICKPFEKGELLAKIGVFMRLKTNEEVHQFTSDVLSLLYREMQAPLSGITGPTKLLLQDHQLSEEQRRHAETIQQSVKRLTQLCEKTQALGNLTSGAYIGSPSSCTVSTLIQDQIRKVAMDAVSQGVEIIDDLQSCPPAAADRYDLGTAIGILLENAVRFSVPGSQIMISLTQEQDSACIRVTDQGEGVPQDVLENLFEVFCNTDIRNQGRGLHLHLPMVYHLLKLYGGSIEAESEIGKGTTFTIRLPLADESSKGLIPSASLASL